MPGSREGNGSSGEGGKGKFQSGARSGGQVHNTEADSGDEVDRNRDEERRKESGAEDEDELGKA